MISDGQQTVTLASAIVELVGRPLSSIWRKQSTAQAFKQKLGEWADEAIDDKGRWLQPVLRTRAFEGHLVRENGYFQPTGRCESSFAWAQLLFALNIRPKGGVLAWRLPPREIDPAVSSDISLEVDGEVMCHIINLYRLYNDGAPQDFSRDILGHCCFPFGRLSLDQSGNKFVATFVPGTNDDLSSQRVPFSYYEPFLAGTHLRFEEETLVANYFNAIHHQISDSAAIRDLPDPKDPMKKRAKYFVWSMEMLRSKHECDDSCEKLCIKRYNPDHVCVDSCENLCFRRGEIDWSRPKLVTRTWVEEASRIKRRVTTNGGEDKGLVDYIIASLHDRPDFARKVEDYVRALYNESDWEPSVGEQLRELSMFSGDQVRIYWSGRSISESDDYVLSLAMAELPSIIESLAEKPRGSWLHELSDMVPEVLEMFRTTGSLQNVPVIVLELGPDHDLWRGTL